MQEGTVGFGVALVTSVVGTSEGAGVGAGVGSVPGAGALPVPSQTAGPGIGYVVAFMASGESILNAIPGSVPT